MSIILPVKKEVKIVGKHATRWQQYTNIFCEISIQNSGNKGTSLGKKHVYKASNLI
jgi:hypothetical protein